MEAEVFIETERLLLRQWKESDKKPFAQLNSDPETLLHFPKTLAEEESNSFVDKTIQLINKNKYGLFAVELKDSGKFIGFTGLAVPSWEADFTPCTEIGWRIYKGYWGKGYATEAAKKVLNFAFSKLKLEEVVAFTSHFNIPSIKVMKRIGMIHDPARDFDHPRIEQGHKFSPHVFYQISRSNFEM